jgi:hypothetical protein
MRILHILLPRYWDGKERRWGCDSDIHLSANADRMMGYEGNLMFAVQRHLLGIVI